MIDSRTSDAIAIAIRFNAPIYTYKNVMEKANSYLKGEKDFNEDVINETKDKKDKIKKTKYLTKSELEEHLKHAIQNENYELAAQIRDQIKKLNK